MPRLFVGNFDFEHRLACGEGTLPRNLDRVNAELAPVWAAIAEPGDAIWTPAPIDPAVLERLADLGLPLVKPVSDPATLPGWFEAVFWGENEWARQCARRWCLRWDGCDPAIVRRVNSRRLKLTLEHRLGIALPGSTTVVTGGDLTNAVTRLADERGWVLKGEFGGAGREVRFGSGPLPPSDLAWAENRFRRKVAIVVEPRLDAVEEVGIQFRIDRRRNVAFDGITPLLSRPNGGYLGSGYRQSPELRSAWAESIAFAAQVADCVAAEGYHGLLGIDAMRYRDADGGLKTRHLQDLNARYTMGRLALGLGRTPFIDAACGGRFRPELFRAELQGVAV